MSNIARFTSLALATLLALVCFSVPPTADAQVEGNGASESIEGAADWPYINSSHPEVRRWLAHRAVVIDSALQGASFINITIAIKS